MRKPPNREAFSFYCFVYLMLWGREDYSCVLTPALLRCRNGGDAYLGAA